MAEKGVPVTPEMTMAAGSNLRRSSVGRTSSSSSGERSLPHYLRASTGSCHDVCKYGRKHTFEAKTRNPMPRKVTRKSLEGGNSVDNVVLPERKKTNLTQDKARFSSISRLSEADASFVRQEVLIKSPICQSPMQSKVGDERKKKLLAKPRPLHYSRSHTANALKILKQEAPSDTRNPEDSQKLVFPKAKERKLPEKCDKILKSKSVKVKPLRSTGSLDNSREKNDSKTGKSFETSREAAKKLVASSTALLSSNSVRRVVNLTARKHGNLKTIPLKTHNQIRRSEPGQVQSEEVQEKTLYVIKIENEEKTQQSDRNDADDNMEPVSLSPKLSSPPTSPSLLPHDEDDDGSEYTETEAEDDSYSEDNEFDNMEAEKTLSGSTRGRSHNLGMLQSKEEDPQSIKLNFSRGKMIEIHPENNSPRRLKFRRGRLLGASQKVVDGLRKNFKRGKEVDCDTTGTKTTPETVVLRHQDVQGKKDAQGLFNNVIEETASKLVETRKSKVKALVGAFETVISLQDGKPSLDTVM